MNGELSVLLSPGNHSLEVETIQFFNGFYSYLPFTTHNLVLMYRCHIYFLNSFKMHFNMTVMGFVLKLTDDL
jgi:hypothetical protein